MNATGGKRLSIEASVEELKLVYRVLGAHLGEHAELMEADFLDALQRALQKEARTEGVDVADHGAWSAWLGAKPGRRSLLG